jgi:hypothetical protein
MKKTLNIFLLIATATLAIVGCKKVDPLPYSNNGNAVTLTASNTAIAPTRADSLNPVLTLSWTSPNYATDTSHYKYVIEIDSSGKNFVNKATKEVIGTRTTSFTGRELNAILLNHGYALGQPVALDFRVVSSYANNNEQITSAPVKVMITPYSDPSVLTSEFTSVAGSASTANNHGNSFFWGPSFPGYNGTVSYTLQYDSAGKNFVNPQSMNIGNSLYTVSLTQQDMNATGIASGIPINSTGKVEYRIKATTSTGAVAYSNVVNVTVNTFVPVPDNLYIVGDATPGGWNNPVPIPSQQFSKTGPYTFSLTIQLTAGKSYLFLPVNGDWSHKYGGSTDGVSSPGVLLRDNAVPGSNTPAPATTGIYKIDVDFQAGTYKLTPVTVPANLYLVGDATAGGWANPVPTPSQQFTKLSSSSFGIITNLTAGKSYLFLPVNGDWSHKYGGATDGTSAGGGTLLADGAVPGSNTPAPSTSGLYKIIVDFATNTYTVTPFTGQVPANLYIVGDATPGGWANPVPVPSQQFTQVSNSDFQIVINLTAGNSYLFLPVNGDWSQKYGGTTSGTSGPGILLADGAVPGSNTPAPGITGTYLVDVNFINNTYTVTPH